MSERSWLRAAFAKIPARTPALAPIEPERIWAAVRGELDARETAEIVDRLHEDPELAMEWRLAVELAGAEAEAATTEADPTAPSPAPAANDRRYGYAALLVAAAVGALVLSLRPAPPPLDPGPGPGEDSTPAMRAPAGGAAISTELPDGSTLPRARFELRWSTVPGADHYELRLSTLALDPLHRALELHDPRATIPAEALAPVATGEAMLWQVTAVMPDGRRLDSPAWRIAVQ